MQVAGRVVLLVPHRGPGMAQDALPPDYQRIMAVVRDAGGPVSTRQVGQELGLEVTVRGKAESAKTPCQTIYTPDCRPPPARVRQQPVTPTPLTSTFEDGEASPDN